MMVQQKNRFEGSRRQKRAALVRILLDAGAPVSLEEATAVLGQQELAAGRPEPAASLVAELLDELAAEGMCRSRGESWSC